MTYTDLLMHLKRDSLVDELNIMAVHYDHLNKLKQSVDVSLSSLIFCFTHHNTEVGRMTPCDITCVVYTTSESTALLSADNFTVGNCVNSDATNATTLLSLVF